MQRNPRLSYHASEIKIGDQIKEFSHILINKTINQSEYI